MDNLLLFIKLLSLKKSRFEKKMHFWDEILWGRFWSCLKHSQCVTSSVTSRSNFWPVTNHSLWFVTGQKFQEICVHKEEGERSSSYTRGCMWRVYRWKSYNFHFHEKAMSHDLLVHMAYWSRDSGKVYRKHLLLCSYQILTKSQRQHGIDANCYILALALETTLPIWWELF